MDTQKDNVKKCVNCPLKEHCKDTKTSWVFFIIGLIATISMRVIEPLNLLSSIYGKAAWYAGVLGFFIFFSYKYVADRKRNKLIKEQELLSKVQNKETLNENDYASLSAILCSLSSEKDRINFIFIAVLSILALLTVFIIDLIKL